MGLFGPPDIEKLKAKREVDHLIKALSHKDDGVREAAAKALGEISDRRAMQPLAAALSDKNPRVRRTAAEALGSIGDTRAVEPLVAAALQYDADVRRHACMALRKIGDPQAAELLVPALGAELWLQREAACRALQLLGDDRSVEPLMAALGDEDRRVRVSAAGALGSLRDRRAVKPLVAALHDHDEDVRTAVVEALGRIGPAAVKPLVGALGDESEGVRRTAYRALVGMERAPKDDAGRAIWLVGHGDWPAAVALGAAAVPPLLIELECGDKSVRQAAVEALGEIGDVRAVEPLVNALGDGDEGVRKQAAEALGDIGGPRAAEALVAVLRGGSLYARWDATHALGRIGAPAVGPLIIALEDKDENVRAAAAEALAEIGDLSAVESLSSALGDESKEVRRAAFTALGRIEWEPRGDKQRAVWVVTHKDWAAAAALGAPAVGALIIALEDRDENIRASAAATLGEMGDPGALEPLVALATDRNRATFRGARPLADLLERVAAETPEVTLRMIASAEFFESYEDYIAPECSVEKFVGWRSADSSRVVQLARQELIRRGLGA